ncbi:MAG: hypothetical protein K5989_03750, partial [Lachnospiraceae bacterium]|nr:hypothetical protein [Lachnospiraceae bacterium]
MRITNRMMADNSLYNINNNKVYLDQLEKQMATQKKYYNPSDDPITAIRSLRFRGSLAEITQYLDRNASDAESWADNTQSSIDTAAEIMRSLQAEYTSATTGTNTNSDRRTYLENMKALAKEFYAVGNTTNESRYIFTGYRTGDSLTFTQENLDERAVAVGDSTKPEYSYKGITEYFDADDIETYSYLARDDYSDTGVTNDDIVNFETADMDETKVKSQQAFRLRLSYDNLDEDQSGTYTYSDIGAVTVKQIVYTDKDGNTQTIDSVEVIENDYEADLSSGDKVYLNKTTGNL